MSVAKLLLIKISWNYKYIFKMPAVNLFSQITNARSKCLIFMIIYIVLSKMVN